MELVRIYKNASAEELRMDTITMVNASNIVSRPASEHTFRRNVLKQMFHGPSDRDVATIEIIGDYDAIETSTDNYEWATWESPAAKLDMSDLPEVGDTI